MQNTYQTIRLGLVGLLGLALIGCQPEGPAEKAGKEMDRTMDAIKESVPSLAPEGPMEKAGKAIDAKLEEAGEKLESMGEAIKHDGDTTITRKP